MPEIRSSNEMDLLASAAAGMSTQRAVLDLAARNVAAAQAGSPEHGYRRLVAQFANASDPPIDGQSDTSAADDGEPGSAGQVIVGIRSEPGTGDALAEMIAVLDAQRSFEQNASVFDIGKRLAERTIDIGRS